MPIADDVREWAGTTEDMYDLHRFTRAARRAGPGRQRPPARLGSPGRSPLRERPPHHLTHLTAPRPRPRAPVTPLERGAAPRAPPPPPCPAWPPSPVPSAAVPTAPSAPPGRSRAPPHHPAVPSGVFVLLWVLVRPPTTTGTVTPHARGPNSAQSNLVTAPGGQVVGRAFGPRACGVTDRAVPASPPGGGSAHERARVSGAFQDGMHSWTLPGSSPRR